MYKLLYDTLNAIHISIECLLVTIINYELINYNIIQKIINTILRLFSILIANFPGGQILSSWAGFFISSQAVLLAPFRLGRWRSQADQPPAWEDNRSSHAIAYRRNTSPPGKPILARLQIFQVVLARLHSTHTQINLLISMLLHRLSCISAKRDVFYYRWLYYYEWILSYCKTWFSSSLHAKAIIIDL